MNSKSFWDNINYRLPLWLLFLFGLILVLSFFLGYWNPFLKSELDSFCSKNFGKGYSALIQYKDNLEYFSCYNETKNTVQLYSFEKSGELFYYFNNGCLSTKELIVFESKEKYFEIEPECPNERYREGRWKCIREGQVSPLPKRVSCIEWVWTKSNLNDDLNG